jgi:hypothetical protein
MMDSVAQFCDALITSHDGDLWWWTMRGAAVVSVLQNGFTGSGLGLVELAGGAVLVDEAGHGVVACDPGWGQGVVNLSVDDRADGREGRAGPVGAARSENRPVTSFQTLKRWRISVRSSVADSRWRRGRKCGDIRLKARNRWARPGDRKPFMACSRWRVD